MLKAGHHSDSKSDKWQGEEVCMCLVVDTGYHVPFSYQYADSNVFSNFEKTAESNVFMDLKPLLTDELLEQMSEPFQKWIESQETCLLSTARLSDVWSIVASCQLAGTPGVTGTRNRLLFIFSELRFRVWRRFAAWIHGNVALHVIGEPGDDLPTMMPGQQII